MAIIDWRFFSKILDVNYSFRVFMPDEFEGAPKILYLLHGLGDDYSCWSRMTSAERYWEAYRYKMIVVMPDGGRSFYTNAGDRHGYDYERFLLEELIPYVESHLPVPITREQRAVCGLSMGGYGSLRLAALRPDLFGSAGSFSGAFCADTYGKMEEFSARLSGPDASLESLFEKVDPAQQPRLKIICGKSDFLLEPNRKLAQWLADHGFQRDYQEYPGNHNWLFWDTHLPEMLRFVLEG